MQHYVEQLIDLTQPSANQVYNMSVEDARDILQRSPAEKLLDIKGSFALVARSGKIVRMARSLDRPMRYFLAKRKPVRR